MPQPKEEKENTTDDELAELSKRTLSIDDTRKDSDKILELYDFPPSFTTKNLSMILKEYEGEYQLKWLDETSAAVIFGSAVSARNAIKYLDDPQVCIRWYEGELKEELLALYGTPWFSFGRSFHLHVYNLGCDKGKLSAAAKDRPETSALVARRLVSNALGLGKQLQDPQMKEKIAKDNEKIVRARGMTSNMII